MYSGDTESRCHTTGDPSRYFQCHNSANTPTPKFAIASSSF